MRRVLIFIVAYNAESTIRNVIERISLDQSLYDIEILIIDDSSPDETFEVGLQIKSSCPYKLTVLKNAANQMYGGNQKIGYHYAIENGFDVVVLLHGDGQYAPELLQDMIRPCVEDEADAVFGSRMLQKGAAIKGGMPLYEYMGNKILSKIQNLLLKQHLSEFHSGYRAYRVNALKNIPFEFNTNDYHFDTEIIIQLIEGRYRIKEIMIPTYYGDEVCYVNGIKYAIDVLVATLKYRIYKFGIFYQLNYDVSSPVANYTSKFDFVSTHTLSAEAIKPNSTVFDIGCSAGYIADKLTDEKSCQVYGIDSKPSGGNNFVSFYQKDIEKDPLPDTIHQADYILLLDIIEHLQSPEAFLLKLRNAMQGRKVTLILTTPNVAFIVTRLMLLFGQFNYGKTGILDITHCRLFTFGTIKRLLKQTGFEIHVMKGVPAPFPKAIGLNVVSRTLLFCHQLAIRLFKRLFSYQIYIEASANPTLSSLISTTIDFSIQRQQQYGQEQQSKTG